MLAFTKPIDCLHIETSKNVKELSKYLKIFGLLVDLLPVGSASQTDIIT